MKVFTMLCIISIVLSALMLASAQELRGAIAPGTQAARTGPGPRGGSLTPSKARRQLMSMSSSMAMSSSSVHGVSEGNDDDSQAELGIAIAKEMTLALVGFIPVAGPFIGAAVNLVWPEFGDQWGQLKAEVEEMIQDSNQRQDIQNTLNEAQTLFDDLDDMLRQVNTRDKDHIDDLISKTSEVSNALRMRRSRIESDSNLKAQAYYLLPYTIPFAMLHIGILRERYNYGPLYYANYFETYGTSQEDALNDEWEDELETYTERYQEYFNYVSAEWDSWYPSQISHSVTSVTCSSYNYEGAYSWRASFTDRYFHTSRTTRRGRCHAEDNCPRCGAGCGARCNYRNNIVRCPHRNAPSNIRARDSVYAQHLASVIEEGRQAKEELMRPTIGLREYFVNKRARLARPRSWPASSTTSDLVATPGCGDGHVGNGLCDTGCCGGHGSFLGHCGTGSNYCNANSRVEMVTNVFPPRMQATVGACGGGSRDGSHITANLPFAGNHMPGASIIIMEGICFDQSLCCSENGYCGASALHCSGPLFDVARAFFEKGQGDNNVHLGNRRLVLAQAAASEVQGIFQDCSEKDYDLYLYVEKDGMHFDVVANPSAAATRCNRTLVFDDYNMGERLISFGEDHLEANWTHKALSLGSYPLNKINEAANAAPVVEQGAYDLLSNNCATFIIDLMARLGVDIATDHKVKRYVVDSVLHSSSPKVPIQAVRKHPHAAFLFLKEDETDLGALDDRELLWRVVSNYMNVHSGHNEEEEADQIGDEEEEEVYGRGYIEEANEVHIEEANEEEEEVYGGYTEEANEEEEEVEIEEANEDEEEHY